MERKVLGKGLGALISPDSGISLEKDFSEQNNDSGILLIGLKKIKPNRYQPRKNFNHEKLQELIDSIREKGVLQPIIVRENAPGDYELIAGERRLRAVKALELENIPAIVKNITDLELLELSIVENIQRHDLNALEEARSYQTLVADFGFTQEQVAKTVGKKRAAISNSIRFLSLPEQVKTALRNNSISPGHAKIVLSLKTESKQIELLDLILQENFSVRQAETYAANSEPIRRKVKKLKKKIVKNAQVLELEEELQHLFGTKVDLFHGSKKGKISIEYYSLEDLQRILTLLRNV
ncbi:MAG: chromosome partitioning protein ParB [Candidatus Omnitrophota bacterium]|nr:MAG: chromosome partitioning protein ParB [Candidatus Omnitrophota bacterium]